MIVRGWISPPPLGGLSEPPFEPSELLKADSVTSSMA
jgi:hypothetical protein